jgi:hypothetical protein
MSVYVVMFLGVTPIGYLQAGPLAHIVGARVALFLGATALLTMLFAMTRRSPRLLRIV